MNLILKNLTLWIAAITVLMILLVLTFSKQGFYDHYLHKKNLSELEERIDSLKRVNDSLSTEIKLLKSDTNKIEQVAREKYGLVKPGEKIYKVRIEK